MIYEIASWEALRDQLRCKEIWVLGADRWRNPDEDLPQDFEQRRTEHYAALSKPLDPSEFIGECRRPPSPPTSFSDLSFPGAAVSQTPASTDCCSCGKAAPSR